MLRLGRGECSCCLISGECAVGETGRSRGKWGGEVALGERIAISERVVVVQGRRYWRRLKNDGWDALCFGVEQSTALVARRKEAFTPVHRAKETSDTIQIYEVGNSLRFSSTYKQFIDSDVQLSDMMTW